MKTKKNNPVSKQASFRLREYANALVEETLDMTTLSSLYVELEMYRKYFLSEHGDTCNKYRLAILLLTLSRFAVNDEDSRNENVSDFLSRYPIFRSTTLEIQRLLLNIHE